MTTAEDPMLSANGEPVVVACEEVSVPKPAAAQAGTGTGTETETETETGQHEIDFVTLGMFIIGRLSSCHRCLTYVLAWLSYPRLFILSNGYFPLFELEALTNSVFLFPALLSPPPFSWPPNQGIANQIQITLHIVSIRLLIKKFIIR